MKERVLWTSTFALMASCGGGDTVSGDAAGSSDAERRPDAMSPDAGSDAGAGAPDAVAGDDAPDVDTGAGPVCTEHADCDDGDPCTIDSCVPGGSLCTNAVWDIDGDGAPGAVGDALACTRALDCDDGDSAVFPGALEMCNGVDDDCDRGVDEGFECVSPMSEACTTTCGSTGTRACDAATCSWAACVPPAETCDSFDNDCDGEYDEDFECERFSSGTCPTTCGSTGTWPCTPTCTRSSCMSPAETCNGADDDCDGLVDETFTCPSGLTGSCTTSCGTSGMRTCTTSCVWGACTPPAEICNGLDDDCDRMRDEGFTCIAGSNGTCTSSCGSTGTRMCDPTACTWGACAPPIEVCNGTDDDCDGLPDETFTCARGATETCTSSCGTTGSRTCSATCAWGTCTPPAEVCNGVDDDCDSWVDDGFTCQRGATRSCWTSCSTIGTETCNASCAWGTCAPPAETCNARDDDCDGALDNGFTCSWGAARSCTTSCGTTGSQSCSSTCVWASCSPPGETCNGLDDNCDGQIDETATCTGLNVCTAGACRRIPSSCTGYRYANHAYAICTTDTTWAGADSICRSYGGHLVTVTSAGEQGFLAGLIAGRCWHGLYRTTGSCTWQWVTGEPVGYTRWDPGQPSSACGDQDCGDFWYGPSWPWDDYWCSSTARYVCEWDV